MTGRCILGTGFHQDGKKFHPDLCSSCVCQNGTSICQRNTCPVLECPVELQKKTQGECCAECPPIEEVRSNCYYNNKLYDNHQEWELNPCRSCKCNNGEIRCAEIKCPVTKCRPNETLVTPSGQCCSKCVGSDGVCTVFGDPHYKTFDGKFFSFQGSCKYLLTSDCTNQSFSIRVTNDGHNTKFASWTKTVTLKLGNTKVNLGQKKRIKVNGNKVKLPFLTKEELKIKRFEDDLIIVETNIGVKILWDGKSYLQVQTPVKYTNKLCGLCGNFNGISRDDLITRRGINVTDKEVGKFANSWRVGGIKACTRPRENVMKKRPCTHKRMTSCRAIKNSDVFGACDSRLNPHYYFEACRMDMCECPEGNCYCDSFAAYARECQRLGVSLPNWRQNTNCLKDSSSSQITNSISQIVTTRPQPHQRHRNRIRKPNHFSQQKPKPIVIPNISRRTPPPLL